MVAKYLFTHSQLPGKGMGVFFLTKEVTLAQVPSMRHFFELIPPHTLLTLLTSVIYSHRLQTCTLKVLSLNGGH